MRYGGSGRQERGERVRIGWGIWNFRQLKNNKNHRGREGHRGNRRRSQCCLFFRQRQFQILATTEQADIGAVVQDP
ncbi:MAG: hypothetical protein WA741_13535, partial [Candidatus Sulfotelmatobacter sp.]